MGKRKDSLQGISELSTNILKHYSLRSHVGISTLICYVKECVFSISLQLKYRLTGSLAKSSPKLFKSIKTFIFSTKITHTFLTGDNWRDLTTKLWTLINRTVTWNWLWKYAVMLLDGRSGVLRINEFTREINMMNELQKISCRPTV